MTPALQEYLRLERRMLILDETDEAAADAVRDEMDPVWLRMTDDDHAWLDARGDIDNILEYHGLPAASEQARAVDVATDLQASRFATCAARKHSKSCGCRPEEELRVQFKQDALRALHRRSTK